MSKFSNLIKNSDVPVLVDFYADWCQPCKVMAPTLSKVASRLDGKLKVLKVNVDKNAAAAQKYQIRGIPTLILFHKNKILWRQSGVVPEAQLIRQLEPFLGVKA
ncbi:thioredoxin [Flammeovirgaceae bacterium SG7u.111]|nr:thioredoxin [Flammeovirgaceae bacterium SG7u.132]WPO37053.1 thioredoxin [Flammeovirgaceae bacterium SG7u.111]